jgi:hypothetical protein
VAAQLVAVAEAQLSQLRAAGVKGRVTWLPHLSRAPFGALAPLRASALLRACAHGGAASEAIAEEEAAQESRLRNASSDSPEGVRARELAQQLRRLRRLRRRLASAETVARCDANDFAVALSAVLRAAGARVRLRATCDCGSTAEPAGTLCTLAAEVPAPALPASAVPTQAAGVGADGAGRGVCADPTDCEWALVPRSLLPPEALAASGHIVAIAARRGGKASPADAAGRADASGANGAGGSVWVSLEWGSQALAVSALGDALLWIVDAQRDDEQRLPDEARGGEAAVAARERVDVDLWPDAVGSADDAGQASARDGGWAADAGGMHPAGAAQAHRVWLVCNGCPPPRGVPAPAHVCVCNVETADLGAGGARGADGRAEEPRSSG